MMTARELVKVAKSLELSFVDFDRISDELMTQIGYDFCLTKLM